MKRTFTAIVCTLLLVAVLAGCGSTNPFDAAAKTYSDFKREQATRRFVENGCTPEDAKKIAKFIQFLDQCFSEHNERALRKASEVDGN